MTATPPASPRIEPPAGGRPWSILHLIRWSTQYLEEKGVESARLDAEHLLAHTLGVERLHLYLSFERPLTPDELAAFKPLLLRRASREPLQHILGRMPFREVELRVDPRALIPRHETEELVQIVLDWAGGSPSLTALDLGTGTGAIALSLAQEGPFRRVVGVERVPEAAALARENVEGWGGKPGVEVEIREGDLFAPVAGERFHVVVSNPPYVPEGDWEGLQPEVRDHDPRTALVSGPRGLDHLARIIGGAPDHLEPGGLLALEIGSDQGDAVLDRLRETPGLVNPRIRRDLSNRVRFATAEKTTQDQKG